MLQALFERGITPDLVVGCSVGALNGVAVAAEPTRAAVDRLTETWMQLQARQIFGDTLVGQISNVVRHGTHLHSNHGLRASHRDHGQRGPDRRSASEISVCRSVDRTGGGALVRRRPGGGGSAGVVRGTRVLPPVLVGDEHFLDGGLVRSVPVGRAVELGAERLFVLHAGRIEQPLAAPRRPWDAALVAFEIARRHQLADELARVPEGVRVHILPTGSSAPPTVSLRYMRPGAVPRRITAARDTYGVLPRSSDGLERRLPLPLPARRACARS